MNTKYISLTSVVHQTCPRCHEGNMFEHRTFSTQFTKMNKSCSHCGLDFMQEPNFYFGAMYFSYAVQLVVFVLVYFGLRYTINPESIVYEVVTIAATFLIIPFNYRISRVLWLNLFFPYREKVNQ